MRIKDTVKNILKGFTTLTFEETVLTMKTFMDNMSKLEDAEKLEESVKKQSYDVESELGVLGTSFEIKGVVNVKKSAYAPHFKVGVQTKQGVFKKKGEIFEVEGDFDKGLNFMPDQDESIKKKTAVALANTYISAVLKQYAIEYVVKEGGTGGWH